MLLKYKAHIVFFVLFCFFIFTGVSFAQGELENPGGGNSNPELTGSVKLQNPLAGGGIDNIPDLVRSILDILLEVGITIVALAIIYAGYKFIAAQGNPTELEKAKQTLKYVLIGAAILLAAYVIAETVVGTINAIRGN